MVGLNLLGTTEEIRHHPKAWILKKRPPFNAWLRLAGDVSKRVAVRKLSHSSLLTKGLDVLAHIYTVYSFGECSFDSQIEKFSCCFHQRGWWPETGEGPGESSWLFNAPQCGFPESLDRLCIHLSSWRRLCLLIGWRSHALCNSAG